MDGQKPPLNPEEEVLLIKDSGPKKVKVCYCIYFSGGVWEVMVELPDGTKQRYPASAFSRLS